MPAPTRASEPDKVVSPKFPIAQEWTRELEGRVPVAPVVDDARVYVALASGQLTARNLKDGEELWRIDKTVNSPMAVAGGLLFISGDNAVEALRGADHASVWTIPRVATTAPIVVAGEWLIAVTDSEVIAIAWKDGRIIWRTPAGGVTIAPAVDEDRVYLGADDGTLIALTLATGDKVWEALVDEGVTALAAEHGVVYAGGGDKLLYCFKNGKRDWFVRVGAIVIGHIAVDDQHVYFTARDTVVRGLDRSNGNQRWLKPIPSRPLDGVFARGHIVFVPLPASHDLPMLFAGNGRQSGTLVLPGDAVVNLPPDVQDTAAGVRVVIVTGGLTNQWQLTLFQTTTEPALAPVASLLADAGADLLTDPALQPIGKVLGSLVLGDPPLLPVDAIGFPIVLQDPPLEPFTTPPGLQLRALSPQLPVRREGS